jgi:hypothetical protein
VFLKPLLVILDYHQWVICSGSKIASDGSLKPLQITFCVVV